jgi:pimeloyl-ACP methyl ester carboxylesterase
MNRIYILLGGFWGVDGYVTSVGMFGLRSMLLKLPNTECLTYQWAAYEQAADDMTKQTKETTIIVIGYSGGGSRATWLANLPSRPKIDLMICYDPSPPWQMKEVGENVKKAISYHNTTPFFFGLGGGVLRGAHVEQIDISENHMLVQSDVGLHQRTVAEVRKVLV